MNNNNNDNNNNNNIYLKDIKIYNLMIIIIYNYL